MTQAVEHKALSRDFEDDVRARAEAILLAGEECPLGAKVFEIVAGSSAETVALWVVGSLRQERFATGRGAHRAPYDPQETRVSEYLAGDSGMTVGMDPVGFLIASHFHCMQAMAAQEARLEALENLLAAAGVVIPLAAEQAVDLDESAASAYGHAILDVFGVEAERHSEVDDGSGGVLLLVSLPARLLENTKEILLREDRIHTVVRRTGADLVGRVGIAYQGVA